MNIPVNSDLFQFPLEIDLLNFPGEECDHRTTQGDGDNSSDLIV